MHAVAAERQLGWVEGWRLVRHPALWVAVAWLVLNTVALEEATESYFLLVGYAVVPMAFVAMVLMAMAVRRSRSERVDELFDVMPVDPARRSVGHGVSALVVGVAVLVLTMGVWLYSWPSATLGRAEDTIPASFPIPRPTIAQALQGPMAVVALCAFGIALARWVPAWLIAIALVIPMFLQLFFYGIWLAPEGARPTTWLWPFAPGWVHGEWIGACDGVNPCALEVAGVDTVTPWWHLAYLGALAVFFVMVAVLRHRRDRPAWLAFGLSGVTLVSLAAAQSVVYERFEPIVGVVGG